MSLVLLTCMVRNLRQLKSLPRYPVRFCLKNTGPGDEILMAIAIGTNIIGDSNRNVDEKIRSKARFR